MTYLSFRNTITMAKDEMQDKVIWEYLKWLEIAEKKLQLNAADIQMYIRRYENRTQRMIRETMKEVGY